MLLGKRPRPHIRRTTSMTGITVDPPIVDDEQDVEPSSDDHQTTMIREQHAVVGPEKNSLVYHNNCNSSGNGYYDDNRFLESMVSPRYHKGRSRGGGTDFVETSHFLRTCGLCNRRLAPGKDIYMYRGDTAFCSLECREQQMKQDERKEKYNMMSSSNKEDHHHHHHAVSSSSSSSSTTTPSTTTRTSNSNKGSIKSQNVAAA